MKGCKIFLFTYFIFISTFCRAQTNEIDSLKLLVLGSKEDTSRVDKLLQLSKAYMSSFTESSMGSANEAFHLAKKLHYKSGLAYALKTIGLVYYNQAKYADAIERWNESYLIFDSIGDQANETLMLNNIGSAYMNQADNAKALDYFFKSLQISELRKDKLNIARAMGNIGTAYSNNEFTYGRALDYYRKALAISEELDDKNTMGATLVNLGEVYLKHNKDDSALYYFQRSLKAYENTENIPYSLNDIGNIYTKKGNYALARQYHEKALAFALKRNLQLDMAQSYIGLGDNAYKRGNYTFALDTYGKGRSIAGDINSKNELKAAYKGLADTYAATENFSQAYRYQTLYTNIKDTLVNIDIAKTVTQLQNNFELQRKQAKIDLLERNKAVQILEFKRQEFVKNTLIASLVFVFIITFILFKLYRKVGRRTMQLRRSLEDLKATQAQLIQSEKMASLGSLTAGIGHEIQNPLNFVNNFSEINVELLQELQQGPLSKLSEADKAEADEIVSDLAQNMEKINHHGKRADAIIKGMLQHSRKNTGQMESTNINALADEYLRLSYHGLNPKDKSFQINIDTNFDDILSSKGGKLDINPQDFGRVLLNLYNNAFYSMTEKKAKLGGDYEPLLTVITQKLNDKIEIHVRDNGGGISQKVLDKIFQPFFTTKPTGQGTGLGLSLSYDIIKAHGGDLKVATEEGKFAEFIINIPTS